MALIKVKLIIIEVVKITIDFSLINKANQLETANLFNKSLN